jgi:two-component system response regulator DesR
MLVHESQLIRQALREALSKESDINVAWELPAGGVVPMVLSQRPDVVVLDFAVTDPAGAGALCEDICDTVDESRVLVLVERRPCAGLLPALAQLSPRVGMVTMEDSIPRLVQGIRQLAAGEFVLDIELTVAAIKAKRNPLTTRERDVLRAAAGGDLWEKSPRGYSSASARYATTFPG